MRIPIQKKNWGEGKSQNIVVVRAQYQNYILSSEFYSGTNYKESRI